MRSFVLLFAVVAVGAAACGKKSETGAGGGGTATATATATGSASGGASASAAAAHPGACKQLLAEKPTRCDAMAKGDPTIESACKEAIDRLSSAGDDGRCWNAMNPPDVGPPLDDVPE